MTSLFARRVCGVLLLSVVAVTLAACSGDSTILTVNGWKLGRQAFMVELDEIARNPGYQQARRQNGQTFKVFKDGSNEEYTPEFVAEFLNERVTFQLAQAELAKRGVKVTDDDRRRAVDIIANGLTSGAPVGGAGAATNGSTVPGSTVPGSTVPGSTVPGSTVPGSTVPGSAATAGRTVLDGFNSYKEILISGVASLQVLQRELTNDITRDDQLPKLYERTKDQFATQACARHILVRAGNGGLDPTTGNAIPGSEVEYAAALDQLIAIKARLDAGEDFAKVATETSQDTATKSKGGDLGCAPKGQFAAAFENAVWTQPVGLIGAPVKSTFGYHLVLVTERRTRSFDEVKDKLKQAVDAQSQEALQQWLTTSAKDAVVTVESQFGVWNRGSGTIDAAGGRATMTLVPDQGGTAVAPSTTTTTVAPAVPRGTR